MNIYMRHPVHGTKIATLEMEAEFDESNGWTRYNPKEQYTGSQEQSAPVNELQRRRGRPPKIAA
jgi:hypothetical protein